jgi:hypothetical protein
MREYSEMKTKKDLKKQELENKKKEIKDDKE